MLGLVIYVCGFRGVIDGHQEGGVREEPEEETEVPMEPFIVSRPHEVGE